MVDCIYAVRDPGDPALATGLLFDHEHDHVVGDQGSIDVKVHGGWSRKPFSLPVYISH